MRWHWMLGSLGSHVPKMASFAIFMAGLGLLPTPGKIGVAARSLLLERYGGWSATGRTSLQRSTRPPDFCTQPGVCWYFRR